jgi:hypothetical protein
VTGPLALVDLLGEGWCVTLTRGGVLEALAGMEVDPVDVRWDVPSDAAVPPPSGVAPSALAVTLLAREVGDDLSLVLEVDGRTGWVGAQDDVLEVLSANGGTACSAWLNPNRQAVLYAADGAVLLGLDPTTARRWGRDPGRLEDRLRAAGFPAADGEDGADALLGLAPSVRAVVAVEALTGVRLTAGMFAGPWAAGPSAR